MDGITDNGDGTISIDTRQFGGLEIIRIELKSIETISRLIQLATVSTLYMGRGSGISERMWEVLEILNHDKAKVAVQKYCDSLPD